MEYKKYFTLSYDDGVEQDKKLIDIFEIYGLKCTFNINSGFFGKRHCLPRANQQIPHNEIPKDEIRQVYARHEISTHSKTHPDLTKLTHSEIITQITDDRNTLSELAGYEVRGHAYPGGAFDERVAGILRDDCGILYGRTVAATHAFLPPQNPLIWHPTAHHGDSEIFTLLHEFINARPTDGDLLFYLWGHAYEFDYGTPGNNWEHIQRICETIAGADNIVFCTNTDFLHR